MQIFFWKFEEKKWKIIIVKLFNFPIEQFIRLLITMLSMLGKVQAAPAGPALPAAPLAAGRPLAPGPVQLAPTRVIRLK